MFKSNFNAETTSFLNQFLRDEEVKTEEKVEPKLEPLVEQENIQRNWDYEKSQIDSNCVWINGWH
jgi:hypothetical protein